MERTADGRSRAYWLGAVLFAAWAANTPTQAAAAHAAAPDKTMKETPAAAAAAWRIRHSQYFQLNWGVELINVHPVSSGLMLVMRYKVIDPERAKVLNDRKSRAYLIDETTGTVLAVPTMENIGELRPGNLPETNRNYFMIFGNPGRVVQAGSRVSMIAGDFRVDGMVVE
jgi:hypothetical protein